MGELRWYSDTLRAGQFGERIPVWARFSASVQIGSKAHPASYTVSSLPGFFFSRVERPVRDVYRSPQSSTVVEGRVEVLLWRATV
jgi:hypothetical protein